MSFSSHFLFFVLIEEVTKIPKYYIIMFVYFFIEQGKMGKTEIQGIENHANKMTKKKKNEVTKLCNELGIRVLIFSF